MSDDVTDQLNAIAARWEHGHDELTNGCALCVAEYDEVLQLMIDHSPPV